MSKRNIFIFISVFGVASTFLQLSSYIIFFRHIFYHDNHVAIDVIKLTALKQRNR